MWKHSWSTYLGGTRLSHSQLATAPLWGRNSFVCDRDEVIFEDYCCGRYHMWHSSFLQGYILVSGNVKEYHFYFLTPCPIKFESSWWDHQASLTNSVVPSVHSEEATAGDSDHSRHGEVGEGVCRHMSYRGIGGKLQNHDDILLHLVLEHERTLLEREERKVGKSRKTKRWWRGLKNRNKV